MKRLRLLITFLIAFQFVHAQGPIHYIKGPSYIGMNCAALKKMFFKHIYRRNYTCNWVQTDSTVELEIKHDSAKWVVYFAFYFDSDSICCAYTVEHCDNLATAYIEEMLKDKEYLWHKIDTDKYISDFYHCELLEVRHDDDKCAIYKRTKLNLTRKQYKKLKKAKKDGQPYIGAAIL